nr:uncharacterized protein LOC106690147 [Halyomorpha halys]
MCRTLLVVLLAACAAAQTDVLDCLAFGPEGCMEQELSRALNNAEHLSVIRFTRHLSLIANNNQIYKQIKHSFPGRGMIKKLVMPFLLGLKFKATAVMPIAIALIALKTWKAFTLGLLSIVLSAALVIFRLTRPKVLNYEVVVPPAHTHHHIVDEHYQARAANDLAYSAHRR